MLLRVQNAPLVKFLTTLQQLASRSAQKVRIVLDPIAMIAWLGVTPRQDGCHACFVHRELLVSQKLALVLIVQVGLLPLLPVVSFAKIAQAASMHPLCRPSVQAALQAILAVRKQLIVHRVKLEHTRR